MTTTVEGYGLLVRNLSGDIIIFQCSDLRFQGRVEVGDVGLVVFAMMQLHYLSRDGWFEGLVDGDQTGVAERDTVNIVVLHRNRKVVLAASK